VPLRLWLQSTSFLAVLAGYCLLLLQHQALSSFQRREIHLYLAAQQVSLLGADLRARNLPPAELKALLLSRPALPGLELEPISLPPGSSSPEVLPQPRLQYRGDETWLVSTVAIPQVHGSPLGLQVRQDVTASVQQEWLGFWLLVVAAGVSSLFTSALLRPVLRRGLTQPLRAFSEQLRGVQAPPRPGDVLSLDALPEELRPIAEAFNELQERLAASWERERNFVDGVAHELRTPITLVSGHAQRLLRQSDNPLQRKSLHLIQQESARMGTLVADLLDLARQDSGRLRLRCQPVEAEEVLLVLYERLAGTAQGRLRLALGPEVMGGDGPLPPAQADPDRLQQCLTALVDNALRYSPPDSPVAVGACSDAAGNLLLWVRDHGPGVAEDERTLIFERFVRGSAGQASDTRGSGIGLAVVKLLIEAMGGGVQVREPPGGGAEFQLRLPQLRPPLIPPVRTTVRTAAVPPSA
jgi:signal transduction histidine kinase